MLVKVTCFVSPGFFNTEALLKPHAFIQFNCRKLKILRNLYLFYYFEQKVLLRCLSANFKVTPIICKYWVICILKHEDKRKITLKSK